MFQASFSILFGLMVMAALLRVSCRLATSLSLPWGRAFGLSALIQFAYRGQLLVASRAMDNAGGPPPWPIFTAIVILTLAAAVALSGWIVRDANGRAIGLLKAAAVVGLLTLFLGGFVAMVFFTMPNPVTQ